MSDEKGPRGPKSLPPQDYRPILAHLQDEKPSVEEPAALKSYVEDASNVAARAEMHAKDALAGAIRAEGSAKTTKAVVWSVAAVAALLLAVPGAWLKSAVGDNDTRIRLVNDQTVKSATLIDALRADFTKECASNGSQFTAQDNEQRSLEATVRRLELQVRVLEEQVRVLSERPKK